MAETQQTIYNRTLQQYIANVFNSTGVTIDPTKWSLYDLQQYILWTICGEEAIFQQLFDAHVADINALLLTAAPQSAQWIKAWMLKFQYDATTPQVLVFDAAKFTWAYPTIDTAKQPIKFCSVTSGGNGVTLIKIADASRAALSSPIINAAQSYAKTICQPGMYYSVVSLPPDQVYMALDVYYNGQYSSVIQTNVINAINNYMASIPFDGVFELTNLEKAILATTGVNTVTFKTVQVRPDSIPVFSGTALVTNYTWVLNPARWNTVSGTCIPEQSPNSLTDLRPDSSGLNNLNLIAE